MSYEHLSRSDIIEDDPRYSAPWRRALVRLGEYTGLIVRSLNLRPVEVTLLAETRDYLLIGISTLEERLALKIKPAGDLAEEVLFCRALTAQRLPVPRILHYEPAGTLVPFAYVLETYFGGVSADEIGDEQLLRAAARQLGRMLRRAHQLPAAGFGQPNAAGRWTARSWQGALALLHATSGAALYGTLLFTAEQWTALRAATLDHSGLGVERPRLIHGDLRPQRVICTIGEHVQLEALVDPGPLLGGDPMYDLACGLLPSHPAAFGRGLLEGYTAAGPLSTDEQQRVARLRLLCCFWEACRRFAHDEDYEPLQAATLELLGK